VIRAINVRFIEEYILTDEALSRHPANKTGGSSGYIEALEGQKLNTGGTKAIIFLKKCRDARNRLAHSPGALRTLDKVGISDIFRLRKIRRDLSRGKDPLSKKRQRRLSLIALSVLFAIAAILLFIVMYYN